MAEAPELIAQKRIKELNEVVSLCQRVSETVGTKGWQEIIEPLLEKMIVDIAGGKMANGRWNGGRLTKAKTDEKREYYIGYKQALIDLHTRIYGYVDSKKRYEEEREALVKGPSKKFNTPMVDDTRYGRDRRQP